MDFSAIHDHPLNHTLKDQQLQTHGTRGEIHFLFKPPSLLLSFDRHVRVLPEFVSDSQSTKAESA
jgi:hypothetical protein